MLAASRTDHPAPRITPSMPPRRRLPANLRRAPKCDGFERQTFQFPQESLNKYELRAEQRRAVHKLAVKAALIVAILAAGMFVAYHTLPKAYANLPVTLAQAEAMRGM